MKRTSLHESLHLKVLGLRKAAYTYMWVRVYVSVTRQECHAKDFAGAVITQCMVYRAILDSTELLATKSQKLQ